ncbi:ser thr kinase [Nannochloropsis gaditana CCMP526]|uniref:ser thr kinase n=1 Tax=Nannochloropsis gaditana (strain CCMP526) TaxID=1093141 RepID=UPI00029F68FD|nr:ser thr kinase [Nannochloropsis gaditana CCMP526]EKU20136.1 ser thr kinase [Nannochloropsis gaditana CCMP526]|eukprot:XP_005856227.1 ser thr kinase [Nannochloropsis gaditana CCMP526]
MAASNAWEKYTIPPPQLPVRAASLSSVAPNSRPGNPAASNLSVRPSCLSLSLSLTDVETPEASSNVEESFDFNDELDNVFLRGGCRQNRVGLAIGAGGLAMRDHPKTFRVAYEDLEIGKVIGKGSTGAVLEALHKPTGTRLALKVINVFDKSRRSQLIREIRTLYDAACPSLVAFYGAFYREGCITLALEMMDGGALANLVAQLGPIPERALANMVFQILWALAYLKHDKRVHRDIKPSNLLINSHGEVKVSDFGLSAELQSSLAMCGTFVGTFKYMSPERIRNDPYDYASDVWSLGLTLIECATGRYPYLQGLDDAGMEEEEMEAVDGAGGGPGGRRGAGVASAPSASKGGRRRRSRAHSCIDMIQAITESEPPTLPPGTEFSRDFHGFLDNMLQKDPRRRLPPEILLGAPWLRQFGAVSLAAAVRNTQYWIHNEAVPGRNRVKAGGPHSRQDERRGGRAEDERRAERGQRGRESSSAPSRNRGLVNCLNKSACAGSFHAAGAPLPASSAPPMPSMGSPALSSASLSPLAPSPLSTDSCKSMNSGGRQTGLALPLPLLARSSSLVPPSPSSSSFSTSAHSYHPQRKNGPPMRSFST